MALEFEKRIKPFVVDTPSIRRRSLGAVHRAQAEAEFQFGVARLAASTPGTLEQKTTAVTGAVIAGLLGPGRPPCREFVRQRLADWNAGKQSVADYRKDRRPRGPRAEPVPEDLVARVRELAADIGPCEIAMLVRRAEPFAKERGYAPLSPWRMRRVLAHIGQHTVTADRHGSRAAEMDALPRYTYPVKHAYDRGALDEGDSRYYAKAVCRVRGIWVSVRPSFVVTRDHRSGIPTGLIVDPTRRIDERTNTSFTTGFDGDDVLAALLSATVPELAPEYMRDVVGLYRQLVWDNAAAHHGLEARVFAKGRIARAEAVDVAADLDEDFGVEETDLPPEVPKTTFIGVRRPDRNGLCERIVGVVKRWSKGLTGDADIYIPTDRIEPGMDLARDRSEVAASASTRRPRRIPIAVEDLPTIEDLQATVDAVLKYYITEHRLKRHGYTPLGAARKFKPRALRSGHDLVRMLEPQTFRVQREGIVVERGGHRVAFEAVDNGVLLRIGATAVAYVDPYLRALWLEQGGRHLVRLRPKLEADAELSSADVAAAAAAAARTASDQSAVLRAASLDTACGPGAADRAWETYERARTGEQGVDQAPSPTPPPPDGPPIITVGTGHDTSAGDASRESITVDGAITRDEARPEPDDMSTGSRIATHDHVGAPVLLNGSASASAGASSTGPGQHRTGAAGDPPHEQESAACTAQPSVLEGAASPMATTSSTPPADGRLPTAKVPSAALSLRPPGAVSLTSLGALPEFDPDALLGVDPDAVAPPPD